MKYFGTVALFAIFVVCAHGRNATWGYRGPDDVLLTEIQIHESSEWTNRIKYNATFPVRIGENSKLITQVRALDSIPEHDGGLPLLSTGGPNHKFVTVIFTSYLGQGIHMNLEVWGHK